ncbi:MAG: hypothetical protein E7610_02980 [Ruminococcaceae bacterium]|nr:hypothetical protein [Oscillospiraceae bacterium]
MERKWTPAQSAAMSILGRTLLISAAAGSGKTATLTERIIRRLTDPVAPLELSRMLIVTFTRAAAAELRERISKALTEAIARDPGNRHLQRQLIGLSSAHISTIDAFCREPVKTHFAEIGLPASSRIADEAELRPLCERVLGDIIDEFYLKYASPHRKASSFSLLWYNPFADLCDSLTPSKNDTDLIPILLNLYNRLLSFPEELERLKIEAQLLKEQADGDFFASAHGKIILEWLRHFCDSATEALDAALVDIHGDMAATKAYSSAFSADLTFCRRLAEVDTYVDAYELISDYKNERLGSLRGADPIYVAHKERRTEIVDDIKTFKKAYFADSPEEVSDQMRRTSDMCFVLYDLLSEYDRRILAEKKSRGICDFTDNRRYLLALLRGSDGNPSGMALDFRERFDEVYIDEYQDVDEMQDEIFRLVGVDHRFMVGDIKQSIYGFRGADPSVFARYRRELAQLSISDNELTGHDTRGNSIFMSENFRCDESVIRVTNAVCGHALRACPETVGYQSGDDLVFGKKSITEDYVSPVVQVSILTKNSEEVSTSVDGSELSGVEAEATYVANEIASLLRRRTVKANGELIEPKDIVILMRNKTALSAYVKALNTLGIPSGSEELEAAEAGRDILHGSDMSYLINLLRVIDNPDHDIPLSEVLRAPFPGLTLEELIEVRNVGDRATESRSLYAGVEEYHLRGDADADLARKLNHFMIWLEKYRRLAETQSASGILRLLRRDEKCACRETTAFQYLYESARTCRTSAFLSLYSFLRYFESKLTTAKNVTLPDTGGDGGRVTIMTIHKSKGLEFPVCFIVRCGQAFSAKSYSSDLIFEKRAGVSMKLYSRVETEIGYTQGKIDTTLRAASALSVKLSEREEEMRVLYVAMTRARERLYIVGSGNEKTSSFREGDRYATLSCNSYLKWVLAGLEAHPEIGRYVQLQYVSAADITPDMPLQYMHLRDNCSEDEGALVSRYASILENHRAPSEMERILRRIPTKVSASRMKKNMLDDCIFFETDMDMKDEKLPIGESDGVWCDAQSTDSIRHALSLMMANHDNEFELLLNQNRRPTAVEKGTAMHLFLQYCDYGFVQRNGIEEEIHRLTELGFLTSRAAEILHRAELSAFFSSSFFAHIHTAKRVERELRFARFVPLSSLTAHERLAQAVEDRTLFVQGSIDLLCIFEDGHIELCDYKTDHITPDERKDRSLLQRRMAELHRDQLWQYAAAVEEMYGVRPSKVYIFSIPLGDAVEITLES